MQDDLCEVCRREVELTQHLFWTCPKAKEAWAASKMLVSTKASRCQNFQDLFWLMVMEDRMEEDKVARLVAIA